MISLGLVCLGQQRPSDKVPPLSFQVDTVEGVVSHRGDNSPLTGLFWLLRGCTYHVGFWENDDYFSAWDLVETAATDIGRRSKIHVKEPFYPHFLRLLNVLIGESPERKVIVFADHQGLPSTVRVLSPQSVTAFAEGLRSKGLTAGWVYVITQEDGGTV